MPGWLGSMSTLWAEQTGGYTGSELFVELLFSNNPRATSLWVLFCCLQSSISFDPLILTENLARQKRHWVWSHKTRVQEEEETTRIAQG